MTALLKKKTKKNIICNQEKYRKSRRKGQHYMNMEIISYGLDQIFSKDSSSTTLNIQFYSLGSVDAHNKNSRVGNHCMCSGVKLEALKTP